MKVSKREQNCKVASLAGSVDGNPLCSTMDQKRNVASLAGSVDGNIQQLTETIRAARSLPSREAWIEIGVNDNIIDTSSKSLPSREAWIEILFKN